MVQAIASGDRSSTVFDVTCALLCLATFFLGMRLISKLWLLRKATWDDLVVCIAWACAVGLSIAIMYGSTVGLGKRDVDILEQWQAPLKRAQYAFTVLYNPALTATKLSILMLYYRMAQARPFFRYATLAVGAIVIVNGIVMTFLNIFQCRPISAAFTDDPENPGKCMDLFSLYLCSAPVNVITDIAILVLPLPMVTSMRLDRRQKVGLIATFMLGIFVTVIDVVRIAYLQEALIQEIDLKLITGSGVDKVTGTTPDFSWHASYMLMWSAVEVNVGIICACALVIKPLLVRIVPGKSRRKSQVNRQSEMITIGTAFASPGQVDGDLDHKRSRHGSGKEDDSCSSPMVHNSPPASPNLEQVLSNSTTRHVECLVDEDRGMDIREFCATADALVEPGCPPVESPPRPLRRLATASIMDQFGRGRSSAERPPIQEPTSFMDFVNLGDRKPLTELTKKEAWWPVAFVSLLFWTWGFANGLVSSLIGQIQSLASFTPSQTIVLQDAYWLGYLLGPLLVGYWVLTRRGFKATFMTGLGVFTVASLTFWPSSSLISYPGFVVSNLLIGSGLSILEVAANPFIALAGPEDLMESRLNFSQSLWGLGSVSSPLLALKVLFTNVTRVGLFNTQWMYLAIALWSSFLGVVFYYVPLSEASDEDLERVARRRDRQRRMDWRVYQINTIVYISVFGVFFMFLCVGAQQQVSYLLEPWIEIFKPPPTSLSPLDYHAIGQAVFAVGRAVAAFVCYIGVPGRLVLLACAGGCLLTSALTMGLPSGDGAVVCLNLLLFFQGPIFPTLFAMTLRGMGRYTKLVSTGLTAALVGITVWPTIAWAVGQAHPGNDRYSMKILLVIYSVTFVAFATFTLHPTLRHWVDPVGRQKVEQSDEGLRRQAAAE